VLSVFFAQPVGEGAKEQGRDAEEIEAQRSAEKFLCFLWFFCALCVFSSIGENLWHRWIVFLWNLRNLRFSPWIGRIVTPIFYLAHSPSCYNCGCHPTVGRNLQLSRRKSWVKEIGALAEVRFGGVLTAKAAQSPRRRASRRRHSAAIIICRARLFALAFRNSSAPRTAQPPPLGAGFCV